MAKKGIKMLLKGSKELQEYLLRRGDLSGMSKVIEENAKDVQRQAKENAPVDSGYLRNWIRTSKQGELQMTVRSNAKYSGYVEHGTVNQNAQPFIQPALNQYKDKYKQDIKDELRR